MISRLFVAGWLVLLLGAVLAPVQAQDTIEPGSVIHVTVLGNLELSQTVTVNEDGTTEYPILGSFEVNGMTATELADLLTRVISRFVDRPRVFVTLADYKLLNTEVNGAVRNPGDVVVKQPAELLDVIAEAGGVTEHADLRRVMIIKGDKEGVRHEQTTVSLIDYTAMTDLEYEPIILSWGDKVIVPTLQLESFVRVLGEVMQPGSYVPQRNATLMDVVYMAGGFTPNSDRGDLVLIQRQEDGSRTEEQYSYGEIAKKDQTSPLVYPGDIIIVGRRHFYEDPSFYVEWIRNITLLISSYVILQRL